MKTQSTLLILVLTVLSLLDINVVSGTLRRISTTSTLDKDYGTTTTTTSSILTTISQSKSSVPITSPTTTTLQLKRPTHPPIAYPRCWNKFCGRDEYCCNNSCGTCTLIGTTCDKTKCNPTVVPPIPSCMNDIDCPSPKCSISSSTLAAASSSDTSHNVQEQITCPIGICRNNTCTLNRYHKVTKTSPSTSTSTSTLTTLTTIQNTVPHHTPTSKPESIITQVVVVSKEPVKMTKVNDDDKCMTDDDCTIPDCPHYIFDIMPSFCPQNKCIDDIKKRCQIYVPPMTTTCGTVICAENEYCCNESCGICMLKELPSKQCNRRKKCTAATAIQCRDDLDCDYDKVCDILFGDCIYPDHHYMSSQNYNN